MIEDWKKSLLDWENNEGCLITVVLTRHCNLRCLHCNIHEWLDTKSEKFFELDAFERFLSKLSDLGKKKINLVLIGGEVLSNFERLSSFVERFKHIKTQITTNLVSLPDEHDVLKNVDISVSLDGTPEDHDAIRGKGTFAKTYKNINQLKKEGYKIRVQATLPEEYFKEGSMKMKKFMAMMSYVGIKKDEIFTGLVVPFSPDKEKDKFFVQRLNDNAPYKIPCCSYRFMSNFVVTPDGRLWNGYYNVLVDKYCLGTIDDEIEDIRSNFERCIDDSHFAKDENCTSCPALKMCWGLYCFGTFKYREDIKPSDLCDREKIIQLVVNEK